MTSSWAASTRCGQRSRAAGWTHCSRPDLATLADVGAAAGDDHLHDRLTAPRAGLPGAAVHEEAVLERATPPVDVAEVVDRGPARVDPVEQDLDHRVAQARVLRTGEPPGGAQRVHAGAEQRLVGG